MAVARHPVARTAPPAPAIISASRTRVESNKGERGEFSADPSVPPDATTVSGRERDRAQSAVTIPERHGCRGVAASVVLVAPRRLGTIIAGAAPNPRRHPISCRRPSIATHSAAQAAGAGRAPRRSISHLVAVHGLAVRSASDAIRAPLTELLKPDGCRAPPRSSHRAAGARHHQRLAHASGEQ